MKIRITESKLREIVSEAVKRAINEIGNTPEGFLAIKNAENKANSLGRYQQGDKFRSYAGELDNVIRKADDDMIEWWNGDAICTIIKEGEIFVNGTKAGYITDTPRHNHMKLKVDDKTSARRIAAWVKLHIPEAAPEFTDWHMYAVL